MIADKLKITLLGCGTSVGVPCLGRAGWGLCDPNEPKNRRQRCALLVQSETTTVLVDAGPDIRNQLLPLDMPSLDGLLITHTHSDHVAGLDDLRVYYWPDKKEIDMYAKQTHGNDIIARMPYMFKKKKESPSYFVPPLKHHEIAAGQSLNIGDIKIDVLHQDHGTTFSFHGTGRDDRDDERWMMMKSRHSAAYSSFANDIDTSTRARTIESRGAAFVRPLGTERATEAARRVEGLEPSRLPESSTRRT